MRGPADVLDALIEVPVVTSFTRIGPALRSRIDRWKPLDSYELTGTRVLVTGATSGLGLHVALRLAGLGAHVVLNGRDRDRAARAAEHVASTSGSDRLSVVIGDLAERADVERLADEVLGVDAPIDALIHNAGTLSAARTANRAGIEATVASQVLGPFLLTTRLLPALARSAPGRVITVSSGGMYSSPLVVQGLQMPAGSYRGSTQYARAKRAQVTLNELWAERIPTAEVVFHAMHPGWVDTPGVRAALPRFRSVMGPLLRDVETGADTTVWLVADNEGTRSSGGFWLDRRRRSIHRIPGTRGSDTPSRRAELWEWCVAASGAAVPDPAARS